jgi:hypothetical protein
MNSAPDVSLPDVALIPILPSGDLVTLVFYLVIAFYAIFTGILYYHWNAYSSDKKVSFITYVVYLVITLPLITMMAGSSFLI